MTTAASAAGSPGPDPPGGTGRAPTRGRLPVALIPLSMTYLAVAMNMTIATVALPTISTDVTATGAQLAWIVNATPMAAAALVLFAGSWADRLGRKRILQLGVTIFLLAAVLSAFARSADQLILLRAITGVGSALAMPTALALTFEVTPTSSRRTAIGIMAATQAIGAILGPLLGGLALVKFNWGAAFLAVTPFLAVAFILNAALLPHDRPRRANTGTATQVDTIGAILVAVVSISLLYTAAAVPSLTAGWDEVVATMIAVVALTILVRWEGRTPHPLFVGAVMRRTTFWLPTLVVFSSQLVLGGLLFLNTQYVQLVLGYSAFGAGLFLLPALLTWALAAATAGLTARRLGVRAVVTGTLLLAASGLTLIGTSGHDPAIGLLLLGLALVGVMGAVPALMTHMAVQTYPESRRTVGSAINSVSLRLGLAFGVAVFGSVLTLTYALDLRPAVSTLSTADQSAATSSLGGALQVADTLDAPTDDVLAVAARDAFELGFHRSLMAGAVLLVIIAVLVFTTLRHNADRDRTATESTPDHLEAS